MKTTIAIMLAVGAGAALAGCSAGEPEPVHDDVEPTAAYRGREYALAIDRVRPIDGGLTARVQLVGGPAFALTAIAGGGHLRAALDGPGARYELDASDELVTSVYTTKAADGRVLGSQLLWAVPNADPARSISGPRDEAAARVLHEDTPHGTLLAALGAVALDAEWVTELAHGLEARLAHLDPRAPYAESVRAANELAAQPEPADLTTEVEVCEPVPVPEPLPLQGDLAPGGPTPPCRTCNLTKSGTVDGPSFNLEVGQGLVKLSATSVHADLSATGWNDDPAFKVVTDSEAKYTPVQDGVYCCARQPDGSCTPNGYTWEHKRGEAWAEAKTESAACASPNDKDNARTAHVTLTVKGLVKVAAEACTNSCDGSSRTRAAIWGEATGCFKGTPSSFENGSAGVSCNCS